MQHLEICLPTTEALCEIKFLINLNPFTFVGYRNNRSCLSHNSLYFVRYVTVPIVIFLNIVKFFYEIL